MGIDIVVESVTAKAPTGICKMTQTIRREIEKEAGQVTLLLTPIQT
jgi:hypothetical protein